MRRFICLVYFLARTHAEAATIAPPTHVHMLVPGFTVRELPVRLSNINSLRFAPDGRLTALGYDGRIHWLRDTDGDGLEDHADIFWDRPTLSVPVGMAWSTTGLYVSSKGKVSLLRDAEGDGRADSEEIVASGWPPTDVGSGGVDATAVTLDAEGNVYFGLLVADYSNAYRLRKRKDLNPAEQAWLVARGQAAEGDPEAEVSLYDLHSKRGTVQKWSPRTRTLETVATGIRVPYTLAFNRAGDLFLTDQEGETWMPHGNPLDELNHIQPGRHYGFPPPHPRWLPNLVSEPPVVGFGPQHQSTCGFVFNEPHGPRHAAPATGGDETTTPLPASPGQGLFGPGEWTGDAIVAGESRGQLWRVKLVKTPRGYVGKQFLIARLDMLTTDVAISPNGDLYVSCHSGPPDWGTGPQGEGKLFKINFTDTRAPQPLLAWREHPTEIRVAFNQSLDPSITHRLREHRLEAGEFVSAADRLEVLQPPYETVHRQAAAPRERIAIQSARLLEDHRVLALRSASALRNGLNYALTLAGVSAFESKALPATVDVEFDTDEAGPDLRWTRGTIELRGVRPARIPRAPPALVAPTSPGGDWARGRALFFSEAAQCSRCHRVRGEGGLAGPDLSNLLARDAASVLRDIREPGASIHPDYTGYIVARRGTEDLTGFVRAQDASSIRLLGLDGQETVVPRADVRELRASRVSLMPEGLLAAFSEAQVKDLLTFLVTERPAGAATARREEEKGTSPPLRSRSAVQAALDAGKTGAVVAPTRPIEIVLVASKQDHGAGEHDYPRWQTNWTRLLGAAPRVHVSAAWEWPSDSQWQAAQAVAFYFWNHGWTRERYAQIDSFLARGGGLVILHAACIADQEPEPLAERLGFSAQPVRTKYRHGALDLQLTTPADHPITRGLPRKMRLIDETYWPLIGDAASLEILATAEEDNRSWPMLWTRVKGRGRVFGSILGHYSWTFDDPFFRLLVLRGMAWSIGEPESRFDALATVDVKWED